MTNFEETMHRLQLQHEQLLTRKNMPTDAYNGIFTRYRHPILTAAHTPLFWRYDLDPATNPYCMERIGINAVMNSAANTSWWFAWKVPTANRFSPWRSRLTASTISVSGTIPSPCPNTGNRQPIFTTCV